MNCVLKNNVFTFNNCYYSQQFGVARGTKLAPVLATLYFHFIERKLLESRHLIPTIYCRCVDDIFIVWEHGELELITFVEELNQL